MRITMTTNRLAVASLFCLLVACQSQDEATAVDLLIVNGTIYDGSGGTPYQGDLAVNGDRVVAIGPKLEGYAAKQQVDATGLAVAPGFINTLSWAPESLIHDGRAMSDIKQGVTLEIFGEGESWGPLTPEMKAEMEREQTDIRYEIPWVTLGEFLDHLVERGVSPNVASFVGAASVRVHELGNDNRAPTPEELSRMQDVVRLAMREGALGVGSALIYTPGTFAQTNEIIALVKAAGEYGGGYTSHLRSEGDRFLEGLDELIEIARASKVHSEVHHLKAAGQKNWPKMRQAIAKIEEARATGLPITANMYPYTAGATGLDAAMPPWVQEGGLDQWVKRLQDPQIRQRVLAEMRTPSNDWENLYLAAGSPDRVVLLGFKTDALKPLTGKTLAEVAKMRGTSAEDTAIDLVIEDHTRIDTAYYLMSEDNVKLGLAQPWVSLDSDAGAPAPEGEFLESSPHPRAYGAFARFLGHYVRDAKVTTLPDAIRRLTRLPAENWKLRDRGCIDAGCNADIVIFNPATIIDHATFAQPHQFATGVVDVFVNGVQVLKNGEHTGAKPGSVVRGPGWVGWEKAADGVHASADFASRFDGFDEYVQQALNDWNGVGIGVAVVVDDKLVFARGYGYRDYDKKLPVTSQTLFQIASNTKLFTAVAAGLLVQEGKLTWDQPIREAVPSIRFYNDSLNNTVTLQDMLAHRTGITRHDSIWYMSDFTAKDIFERLKYLEPAAPLRQVHLYNNLMYAGVGHIVELETGLVWKDFVQQRVLNPLDMRSTVFSISDMLKHPDYGVTYDERRDSDELYRIPYYEDTHGIAAAGSVISNLDDMSHWLIALMNEGRYAGRQVLPASVLEATFQPSIVLPNELGEAHGWWELQNPVEGIGRRTASYRGHLITYHGGALPGFYSQVSYLPQDGVGVIVFTIGKHTRKLTDAISYNIYERFLGMSQTPWASRWLEVQHKDKQASSAARASAGVGRVAGTRPSHPLQDYVGNYEDPAYGALKIGLSGSQLQFEFNKLHLPLTHFHYDRFDTWNDEQYGVRSVNFQTNPLGDIDRVSMSLDEAEATFVRRPEPVDRAVLDRLIGTYKSPDGDMLQVSLQPDGSLVVASPEGPTRTLIPYKNLKFRVRAFSDVMYEFVMVNDRATALKESSPSGEYVSPRVAAR